MRTNYWLTSNQSNMKRESLLRYYVRCVLRPTQDWIQIQSWKKCEFLARTHWIAKTNFRYRYNQGFLYLGECFGQIPPNTRLKCFLMALFLMIFSLFLNQKIRQLNRKLPWIAENIHLQALQMNFKQEPLINCA